VPSPLARVYVWGCIESTWSVVDSFSMWASLSPLTPLTSHPPVAPIPPHPQELRCIWSVGKKWDPYMPTRTREGLIHGWHKAVERSLGWVEKEGGEEAEGVDGEAGGGRRGGGVSQAGAAAAGVEAASKEGEGPPLVGGRPKLKRFATMRMQRQDSDARKQTWGKALKKQLRGVDWGVVGSAALFVLGGLGLGFALGNRYKLTRA
jgi:hypothetical protein